MARKKKEETPIVEEAIVEEIVEVVEEIVEEVVEPVADPINDLVGQKWEMGKHTITEVISETDASWLVRVSDGCTYHLLK